MNEKIKKEIDKKIDSFYTQNKIEISNIRRIAKIKFDENPGKGYEIMEEFIHKLELLSKKITTGLVNILKEGIKEEIINE